MRSHISKEPREYLKRELGRGIKGPRRDSRGNHDEAITGKFKSRVFALMTTVVAGESYRSGILIVAERVLEF